MSDEEEEMLPAPRPFFVTYSEEGNHWYICCPEPHSVDHAYTQAKSGRRRWILTPAAKLWREKLQNAIASAWDKVLPGNGWDETAPISYLFEWFPKAGVKQDLSNRKKLMEDALNKTAIWKDDSQVMSYYDRKVEGSSQTGIIVVKVYQYSAENDSSVVAEFTND